MSEAGTGRLEVRVALLEAGQQSIRTDMDRMAKAMEGMALSVQQLTTSVEALAQAWPNALADAMKHAAKGLILATALGAAAWVFNSLASASVTYKPPGYSRTTR